MCRYASDKGCADFILKMQQKCLADKFRPDPLGEFKALPRHYHHHHHHEFGVHLVTKLRTADITMSVIKRSHKNSLNKNVFKSFLI